MKREKKKYLAWGLTAFLTGCALLIFYDVFYRDNSGTVQAIFAKLFSVLTPVLYGLGMAYLLAPIVNFLERAILRLRDKLERKRGRAIRIHKGWLRAASIFLTWAVVLVLVYLLLSMLVAVAIIAAVPKFGVLFTVLAEELPLATRLALTLYPLSACLPLLVVLSWFAWPRPASRGRAALLTGLACLLLAPLLVGAALYLPLLQMGALI